MAFQAVKLKNGPVRWLRTGDTQPLGRHEIANLMFERYLMQKEQRSADLSPISGLPRIR